MSRHRLISGGAIALGAAISIAGAVNGSLVVWGVGLIVLLFGLAVLLVGRAPVSRAIKQAVTLPRTRQSTLHRTEARSASPDTAAADPARSGFPTGYPKLRVAQGSGRDRTHLLMGVTTWNRQRYLERFVETFAATRNHAYAWTLVIADDGSNDGTLDYLSDLRIDGCTVVVIKNRHRHIAGQTNSILATTLLVNPDLAFKADDDVFFADSGWDDLYLDAVRSSGFGHLIYHNREWKAPHHEMRQDLLVSSVNVVDVMGCFYTFTPQVIEDIGYFDEVNFPVRGHSHIDWSARSCRAGHNEAEHAWDAAESSRYICMWQGEDYFSVVNWDSPAVQAILAEEETRRRMSLVMQPDRRYVEHRSASSAPDIPRVSITPMDASLAALLTTHGVGDVQS